MEIKDLYIEKTEKIPQIVLKSDGTFRIYGRFLPDNPSVVFNPIFNWVKNAPIKKVDMEIGLEYINTCATMQLFNLLKIIDENQSIDEFNIKWIYEEGDEDLFETGLIYSEQLKKAKFEFVEQKEF